jgi:hypothetical protein
MNVEINILSSDGSSLTTLNPSQSKYLHVDPDCLSPELNTIKLSESTDFWVDMLIMFQEQRFSCLHLISFLDSVHGIVGELDKQFQLSNLDNTRTFTWYVEDALVNNGRQFRHDHPRYSPLIFLISDLLESVFPVFFTDSVRKWLFEHALPFFAIHGNDTIHAIIKCLVYDAWSVKQILTQLGDNGDYEWLYFFAWRSGHKGNFQDINSTFLLKNNISMNIFVFINALMCSKDRSDVKEFLEIKEALALPQHERCMPNYSSQFRRIYGAWDGGRQEECGGV